jgi:hypothetical protein
LYLSMMWDDLSSPLIYDEVTAQHPDATVLAQSLYTQLEESKDYDCLLKDQPTLPYYCGIGKSTRPPSSCGTSLVALTWCCPLLASTLLPFCGASSRIYTSSGMSC